MGVNSIVANVMGEGVPLFRGSIGEGPVTKSFSSYMGNAKKSEISRGVKSQKIKRSKDPKVKRS